MRFNALEYAGFMTLWTLAWGSWLVVAFELGQLLGILY